MTYDIQPLDILVVTHAVQALNGTAVFGLNFRRGSNSSWAVAHAKGIDAYGDWSRTTMEIGNEVHPSLTIAVLTRLSVRLRLPKLTFALVLCCV